MESRSDILNLDRDVTLASYLIEISGSLIVSHDTRRAPFSLLHQERNKGMTDAQFKELMSVVGMANETNRLVAGYQVEVDERFKPQTGR